MKINSTLLSPLALNKLKIILGKERIILASYLFGSKINGLGKKDSDLDLAVVVSDRKKYQELDLLPMISKISFPADVDLSVVDLSSSPILLFQIIKNGICLYEKSKQERFNFEAQALRVYYDTQYMRDIYHYYLDKSIKEDTYGRR